MRPAGRQEADRQGRTPISRDEFLRIMSVFPTGVAVVTTVNIEGIPRGLTTNAFTSVSAEPPILLVCMELTSRTLPALRESRRFVVNFMGDDCEEICRVFASKAKDKFERVAWRPGLGGVPVLHESAVAHAECAVRDDLAVGDHAVITGIVEAGSPPSGESTPMVYFRREFHRSPARRGR
jgi:flavin reductase (DIM6/NTAB) family NADH-FMN oxidoreductase RutF